MPSPSDSPGRCASWCRRDPFGLPPALPPGPATFETDDSTFVAGGIDDERERVVEPVVKPVADLVGQPQANVEAPVGERELFDLEARRKRLGALFPAEIGSRVARAGDEQAGRVAQLERQAR